MTTPQPQDEQHAMAGRHVHAWAREGIPHGHVRCVDCNMVYREELQAVGMFDRSKPHGIDAFMDERERYDQ